MNPSEMMHGVDVSGFQGAPATWKGAAGPITWAAVKFTELSAAGAYVSPDAAADWAYLAAQELGRVAYLFAHPSMAAAATVTLFVNEIRAAGISDSDAIMIDLETTDGLPAASVAAWAAQVADLLHRELGRTAILYTYLSFAQEGNCAGLGHLPLAISEPSSPMGEPMVPAPWTSWVIHQYSTSEPIDRDVARFASMAAMTAALGKPQEEDMRFISSVTLAGPSEIRPSQAASLTWKAVPGQPSLLGPGGIAAKPGYDGAAMSALSVHIGSGSHVRLTIAEMTAGGRPGEPVEAEYSPAGGWTQFTAAVPVAAGSSYEVTVTNFGTVPAPIKAGTWQLLR